MKRRRLTDPAPALIFALAWLSGGTPVSAQVANGFDLTDSLVPEREILGGGPPRDGIRALSDPARQSAESASWIGDGDRVIGVVVEGKAVAYPLGILNWHEVVNDVVGGRPIAVTYCPLCGTGVVFDARIDGKRAVFGVSGLLYKSDVLLYERSSESLFSQLMMKAITGPLRGMELQPIPATHTIWSVWVERHPQTEVLSTALPYGLDYGTDPYEFYHRSGTTMFPVRGANRAHPPKSWAFLLLGADRTLIVTEKVLRKVGGNRPARHRAGRELSLAYDPRLRELRAAGATEEWTVVPGYWFALTAFYPRARILDATDLQPVDAADEPSP